MERVAVFVDAGYLFAQGSIALCGQKLPRRAIQLEHEKAIQTLEAFAKGVSGLPILRTYWYDGTSTGPTLQHNTLAHLPSVKVRLGFVNSVGEQKGVDSLIVTDMIALARNRALADIVLLSGDEDLRVGVQQAQEFGVRVHVLGIRPSRGSQSLFLLQEADTTHEWGTEELAVFLSCTVPSVAVVDPSAALPVGSASGDTHPDRNELDAVAQAVARDVPKTEISTLVRTIQETGQVPKELDGQLLTKASFALKVRLEPQHKKKVRLAFLRACVEREAAAEGDEV